MWKICLRQADLLSRTFLLTNMRHFGVLSMMVQFPIQSWLCHLMTNQCPIECFHRQWFATRLVFSTSHSFPPPHSSVPEIAAMEGILECLEWEVKMSGIVSTLQWVMFLVVNDLALLVVGSRMCPKSCIGNESSGSPDQSIYRYISHMGCAPRCITCI